MALKDLYAEYAIQTDKLSEICRQLGFAAGGVIWIFRFKNDIFLPSLVLVALISLLIYFFLDLLQYKIAVSKIHENFTACHKEYKLKNIPITDNLDCPRDEKNLA